MQKPFFSAFFKMVYNLFQGTFQFNAVTILHCAKYVFTMHEDKSLQVSQCNLFDWVGTSIFDFNLYN